VFSVGFGRNLAFFTFSCSRKPHFYRTKILHGVARSGFAQKRGLTPYRKGKPALQPQRVRGLSPFLGKAPRSNEWIASAWDRGQKESVAGLSLVSVDETDAQRPSIRRAAGRASWAETVQFFAAYSVASDAGRGRARAIAARTYR